MQPPSLDSLRALLALHRGLEGDEPAPQTPYAEAEIASFEATHGVTLPDELRTFYREIGAKEGLSGGFLSLEEAANWLHVASASSNVGVSYAPNAPVLAREFLLSGAFVPIGAQGKITPSPVPVGRSLADGCLRAARLAGGWAFVVVTGPARGQVWEDFTEQDGVFAPTGLSFLAWAEARLADVLVRRGIQLMTAACASGTWEVSESLRAIAPQLAAIEAAHPSFLSLLGLAWSQHYLGAHEAARSSLEGLRARVAAPVVVGLAPSETPAQVGFRRAEAVRVLAGALFRPALEEARAADSSEAALLRLAAHEAPEIHEALAARESLPPSVRAALAASPSWEVRQQLASSPGCDDDTLVSLALAARQEAPHATATPSGLGPIFVLEALLRRPTLPAALLSSLQDDADTLAPVADGAGSLLLRALALRHDLAPARAASLAADERAWVRHGLAQNETSPPDLLLALAKDSSAAVRAAVADNPYAPEAALLALVADENGDVAARAARNPAAPWEARDLALRSGVPGRCAALALHPGLSAMDLDILSYFPDEEVLRRVARHPNTGQRTLRRLLELDFGWLKPLLAGNPNLPAPLLEDLSHEGDERIRSALLGNPALSEERAERLGFSEDRDKRRAENEALPPEELAQLAAHPDAEVRALVRANPQTPPHVLRRALQEEARDPARRATISAWEWCEFVATAPASWVVRSLIYPHPSFPPALLRAPALYPQVREPRAQTAWGVVLNPWCGAEVLDAARQHPYRLTHERITRHPNLSAETARAYAEDSEPALRASVALHPALSRELLERLTEDQEPAVRAASAASLRLSALLLVRFFSDDKESVRAVVARNPNLPGELLVRLARDRVPAVRVGVALHPNTPRPLIDQLKLDIDENVRAAAQWRALAG